MSVSPHLIFDYPVVIREQHLDTFGHVNNAVYLQIFEEARWQLITERGYGLEEVRRRAQGPVILEIQMRFLKELKLRDEVVVRTQLQSLTGKTAVLKQQMIRESEAACEADFRFGLFDLRARRLIEPTPEWLNAIGAI